MTSKQHRAAEGGPPKYSYRGAVCIRELLTADECEQVRRLVDWSDVKSGTIGSDEFVVRSVRRHGVVWLPRDPGSEWFYKKFSDILHAINARYFGYDIEGLDGSLQFSQYEPGQFYDWHQDIGPGRHSYRKLSGVVMLSAPSDYRGGGLRFSEMAMCVPEAEAALIHAPPQGSVVAFPSFQLHRVQPTETGVRQSVVGWMAGPTFR